MCLTTLVFKNQESKSVCPSVSDSSPSSRPLQAKEASLVPWEETWKQHRSQGWLAPKWNSVFASTEGRRDDVSKDNSREARKWKKSLGLSWQQFVKRLWNFWKSKGAKNIAAQLDYPDQDEQVACHVCTVRPGIQQNGPAFWRKDNSNGGGENSKPFHQRKERKN